MNKENSFSLKKPTLNGLFTPTEPTNIPRPINILMDTANENVVQIPSEKLVHYRNHGFKLYVGERQADMVESIKASGIFIPLIVRELSQSNDSDDDIKFEILSGHNRFVCGAMADLVTFPCIVKSGLTDEEAHIIVTETNLIQRSFADLFHSERAEALATHYNAIKKQGKRTDLITQIDTILSDGDNDAPDTSDNNEAQALDENLVPSEQNSLAGEIVSEKYGLSKSTIARYIRIHSLIDDFKLMLDKDDISVRAAVCISYLDDRHQAAVIKYMNEYGVDKITMKQAEQLKALFDDIFGDDNTCADRTKDTNINFALGCVDILLERNEYEKISKPTKKISFKLDREATEPYFEGCKTEEDMQNRILEALDFYWQHIDATNATHSNQG